MKKYLLSFTVISTFVLYSILLHFWDENEHSRIVSTVINQLPTQSPDTSMQLKQTPIISGNTPPPQPIAAMSNSKYKDGTYTGNVADAFYGNIQVNAVISGGKIVDVVFLQYPNDRSTSIEINSQAMPILKQEAITSQSANVDGVSGATASSQAFIESLGTALQKAAI